MKSRSLQHSWYNHLLYLKNIFGENNSTATTSAKKMCSFWESNGASLPNMVDIILFFSILPVQRFPVFIGRMHCFQKYITETTHKSFLDYALHPCKKENTFLSQSSATKHMNQFLCLMHAASLLYVHVCIENQTPISS